MAKIKQIIAREVLSSRGNPTVEAVVILSDGATGIASYPSSTLFSSFMAAELHDHDQKRYKGLGVLKAVANIQEIIAPKIIGIEASKQQEIDRIMIDLDGTQNKGRLGSNATLPVSMAVAKAASQSSVLPLFLYLREFIKKENMPLKIPTPIFNVINGGKRANGNLDFAEFFIIPASSKSYEDSLNMEFTIYKSLENVLFLKNLSTFLGAQGGFAPPLASNADAISLIIKAIEPTSLKINLDVFLGIAAKANNFFQDNKYHLRDSGIALGVRELTSYYKELNKQFHLLYIEDGFSENDWNGWTSLYLEISSQTIIVGGDLISTNPYRLQTALDKRSISAITITPGQIGTVIEAMAVLEIAKAAGLKIVVSSRDNETNDDFISDFAVAVSSDYIKFQTPVNGENVAKYNRLSQIEKQIKSL